MNDPLPCFPHRRLSRHRCPPPLPPSAPTVTSGTPCVAATSAPPTGRRSPIATPPAPPRPRPPYGAATRSRSTASATAASATSPSGSAPPSLPPPGSTSARWAPWSTVAA
ncbi:unnamed protein product [Musa textilis]